MGGALIALSGLAVAACGTAPGGTPPPQQSPAAVPTATTTAAGPSTSPTPAVPACVQAVPRLTLEEQAGQLFMVGHPASHPVTAEVQQVLRDTHTGQVLLLENTSAGVSGVRSLSDRLRTAAGSVQGIGPLIAADQEGGQVQRLQGAGFDTIPSASQQAKMPPAELQTKAKTWGEQLREAGVQVDLAPVADTVPSSVGRSNQPIGALQRGYGSEPGPVGKSAVAFTRGMGEAKVATSVKHFPNLGRVTGNTDLSAGVTDSTTTRSDAAVEPFRRAVEAGADMVMVSTAIYSKIDPDRPATLSKVVVTDMIRRDLGFDGVIISDDMGAAKQVAAIGPGDRAVRFLEAGGDVVINGDPSIQKQMYAAVVQKARSDPAFAAEVQKKATRVAELKARHDACG